MLPPAIEIQNLLARYAELVDDGDFAGVGELFSDAVVTVEGSPHIALQGVDDVRGSFENFTRRFADNNTPHTRHVTTNLIIELEDGSTTAHCRSYFTVFQATTTLALQPILTGRYHDRLEYRHGSWTFAARHMLWDLPGDLSQHMLQDPLAAPNEQEGD